VLRHQDQRLEEAVTFDPAALAKKFDVKSLSEANRQRLGIPAISGENGEPDRKPEPPREGSAFEIRNLEESALVATMQAQGKSAQEIQTSLDNLRRSKAESTPPTNDISESTKAALSKAVENGAEADRADLEWLFGVVGNDPAALKDPANLKFMANHTDWAEIDGKKAGGLFGYRLGDSEYPKVFGPSPGAPVQPDHWYIDSVAVTQAAQGRGIASRLLSDARDYARDAGCGYLSLEVYGDNVPAYNLYTKQGFKTVAQYTDADNRTIFYMVKDIR
jgi:ribosomal protein S18 acetylase RimI-like enzyme